MSFPIKKHNASRRAAGPRSKYQVAIQNWYSATLDVMPRRYVTVRALTTCLVLFPNIETITIARFNRMAAPKALCITGCVYPQHQKNALPDLDSRARGWISYALMQGARGNCDL